jgi:polyhydroxybutyrate depolymerase
MNQCRIFLFWLYAIIIFMLAACNFDGAQKLPIQYEELDSLSTNLVAGAYEIPRQMDDYDRPYLLYLPESYSSNKKFPLLLMLHGGGGSAAQFARSIAIEQEADQFEFVVVFANGTNRFENSQVLRTWNSGHCCTFALENNIDDVGFLSALINELSAVLSIDPERLFVAGLSNGGMMANRLAAERSDIFAGAAVIAGSLGGYAEPGAVIYIPEQPDQSIHYLAIHGRLDQNVLYAGGHGPNTTGDRIDLSVDEQMSFWANTNGCGAEPTVHFEADDLIRIANYENCITQGNTQLITLENAGHAWPGARESAIADVPSQLINANQVIFEFFSQP